MRRWLGVAVVAAAAFGWASWQVRRVAHGQLVEWRADRAAVRRDREQIAKAWGRLPEPARVAKGPDIVVIVLDTVRADRLGMYGYAGETTPRLDAWSADARVYTQMWSDAAWTLPAHASLFTGKAPIAHGAHGTPVDSGQIASPLARGTATVANSLARAGWRTVGVAANKGFLDSAWQLDQGFELWLCEQVKGDTRKVPYTPADRITAMAEEVLTAERDAPLFLFLNYMDAHAPYVPREGYVRDPSAIDRRVLPYGAGWEALAERLMADHEPVPAALRAWSEAYDAELRYLDEQVGGLLSRLPELGVGDDDYVFVLADHGEYLGEHDLVEHSKDLYEPVLRVPLLVRGPGYAAGRDATPIQTHDVARLVLDAAGLPPLDAMATTATLQVAELYYARHRDLRNPRFVRRFNRIRRAFRLGDHKLIVGPAGVEEAYDLAADPGERDPVEGAAWVAELRTAGDAWVAAQSLAPAAKMQKPADTEALRALGYVE